MPTMTKGQRLAMGDYAEFCTNRRFYFIDNGFTLR